MRFLPSLVLCLLFSILSHAQPTEDSLSWPPITQDSKPWTRWWWMGNAVNKADLTRELERLHNAGLGGVEVTTIYGVRGAEAQFLDFLSPQWMGMLAHTTNEAQRLDMGVDMPTGSGWCFGGPNVSAADANATVLVKTFDMNSWQFAEKFDPASTQALVAFSADGTNIDLTDKIAADGSVDSPAPATKGPWRLYAISQKPSGRKVKRPAPGGEGWMLNLLQPDAMDRYLVRFTEAFADFQGAKLDAMFHDSYEYKSDWAPDFFAQFEKRRGYRLQTELPAFFENKGDADHVARVKADYRRTVSELIEDSISRWTKWSHDHGWLTRNQAHGSPGNWLDIYAASDIPETEMFYKDRDVLVSKFASSAAHVTGRNLVGAEAATWVAEHFAETLADLKYLADDLFLSGVNRITWHGTAYSPDDAVWPGWCFYASTEMNPRNAIWRDVPALNAYVAHVQSMLQGGRPDNDILLYWPIDDFWHNDQGMLRQFTVHARDWFTDQPIGKAARQLWDRGYAFDYVSDKQLQAVKNDDESLDLYGNKFRVVFVPACTHMPVETLRKLLSFAKQGATVVFENHLPTDVPGAKDVEARRAELKKLTDALDFHDDPGMQARVARFGRGQVWIGKNVAFKVPGVTREQLVDDSNLRFVRRVFDGGHDYFIVNHGTTDFEGSVPLRGMSAAILDPITGRAGFTTRNAKTGAIDLRLNPGESIFVRTFQRDATTGTLWANFQPAGSPVEITGAWTVKFLEGGPVLPKELRTKKLTSWTQLGGPDAESFAGTALYTLTFDAPGNTAEHWSLDLGKVSQSARVRLNGQDLGTVFTPPFRVAVETLKPKGNLLEVEVTSTSANRIRDLDRRKVPWKIFYDANVLNVNYKPFEASTWPLADAGLLGPVTLQPERR
jgi:alpha-L-rhamnosidase